MFAYRKYNKYLIAVIITISLSANLFFAIRLKSLKEKVISSNAITSTKLESAIRNTMYSLKELNKTGTEKSIKDLQFSVQQLVLIFNNWIDLNQSEENPNESLIRGLGSLETLRNTIVYYLENQYNNNDGQLTSYDVVFLDKICEKLDRLMIIYNNIEKRIDKIKNTDDKGDGGLCQWAANIDEISKLYAHSKIPNEHPQYMELDSVLIKIDEAFPMLRDFQGSKNVQESVQIRDGVHYYEVNYYYGDELNYLVRMDAIDGSLRFFEDYTGIHDDRMVFKSEALSIAKNFMNKFESYSEVTESASIIIDGNSQKTIYAFQFTPVLDHTAIVSDCINVNISSIGGNIVKYSSNFSDTQIPNTAPTVTLKDIKERYKEQFTNMEYEGLSVVRSFYTYYRPVVTYNYRSVEKENIIELYFDVGTGKQVHESYSAYTSIPHIAAEGYY